MNSPFYDSEMGSPMHNLDNAFSEKSIRLGFIRKVYGILMVQLIITLSFIAVFLFVDKVKYYSMQHPELFIVASVLMFGLLIALACCESVRRKFPANFICLFLFTILESFLLGAAASHYDAEAVMIAVGICAVICLGLTLFAFQTKYDFTMMGGMLLVALIVFFCFGILSIFFQSKVLQILYASIGALIFSLYLVFDTQLMMGGSHKCSISPEEYIFGALNLYLDIIQIFTYILQLVAFATQRD